MKQANKKEKLQKPAIFSFFAGAGFLDLGFEMNEYEVVFVNEIFKPFLSSYIHSRKVLKISEPRFGYHQDDIKKLLEKKESSELNKKVTEARKSNVV